MFNMRNIGSKAQELSWTDFPNVHALENAIKLKY